MLPYSLTNFKIHRYYHKKPKCEDVFSRNSVPSSKLNRLPKIKKRTYVINIDEYESIGII